MGYSKGIYKDVSVKIRTFLKMQNRIPERTRVPSISMTSPNDFLMFIVKDQAAIF
jgi:hypothetical protein